MILWLLIINQSELTSVRAEKEELLHKKAKLEKQYEELLNEENALREQELEVRKYDTEIEKENKIVQHKLQEIQEERKNLVIIQEQLNHEYNLLKPLIDVACDEMQTLR